MKIMAVLKAAYPRYYSNTTDEDAKQAVLLWQTMLEDYTYDVVSKAVKALIAVNKFPPSVAEVIEKIQLITQPQEMSELEAWQYIRKAVKNGYYGSQEEWEKLPPILQQIVGPETIRAWAMIEGDDCETVIQSNFMRSYRARVKSAKEYQALPSDVKQYAAKLAAGMDLNMLEDGRAEITEGARDG
jgi:hypothetical protein